MNLLFSQLAVRRYLDLAQTRYFCLSRWPLCQIRKSWCDNFLLCLGWETSCHWEEGEEIVHRGYQGTRWRSCQTRQENIENSDMLDFLVVGRPKCHVAYVQLCHTTKPIRHS